MAQSYQLIGTVTVGSGGAASIDFTNIPQNYTDLCVLLSVRSDRSASVGDWAFVSFNGTTTGYTGATIEGVLYDTFPRIFGMGTAANSPANSFGNSTACVLNYAGSNNKSWSVDMVASTNTNDESIMDLHTGLWSNSAAITSIALTPRVGSAWVENSTAYLYGIGGSRASGGTITADGNYTYHTFTSTGTFTALERIRGAEALVIAGGGGGGYAAGGGGAGGFRTINNLLLPAGNTYTVTVGAGGTGGSGSSGVTSTQNTAGSNSVFSTITSSGGGRGASYDTAGNTGFTGGSGGGGGNSGNGGAGNSGSFSPSEGNNGGSGTASFGGGGGGAGAVGGNGVDPNAGAGGIGASSYSSWGYATSTGQNVGNTYYYAGGGGGRGSTNGGAGGSGGGGAGCSGSSNSGVAGTANTGGGGGSGGNSPATSGNGGSGVVIIRYPNS